MIEFPKKVMIDDQIYKSEEAKISVFDRGFLFGDGVYEVMLQKGHHLFLGDEHLERLASSLTKTGMNFDVSSLPAKIDRLLTSLELKDQDCVIYMQVTRGMAPRTHEFPQGVKTTFMMYANPFHIAPVNQKDLKAITGPEIRWSRCDIKTTSLQGSVMVKDDAVQQGSFETIFIRDHVITESSHSNVFFVKDNTVYTHPANHHILNGITRQKRTG